MRRKCPTTDASLCPPGVTYPILVFHISVLFDIVYLFVVLPYIATKNTFRHHSFKHEHREHTHPPVPICASAYPKVPIYRRHRTNIGRYRGPKAKQSSCRGVSLWESLWKAANQVRVRRDRRYPTSGRRGGFAFYPVCMETRFTITAKLRTGKL